MASMLEMISLDHLFGEFMEQQEATLGYLVLLPSCHHLASLHRCAQPETLKSIETACCQPLRGLFEKGPCFCWVFTVTNKTQLAQYDRQH